MPPRGIHMKGQFMVGATYCADRVAKEEVRKATIARGQFMTSTPAATKRAPLPPGLAEFEDTITAAGPLQGPQFEKQRAAVAEIARRLEAVREALKTTKAKRK